MNNNHHIPAFVFQRFYSVDGKPTTFTDFYLVNMLNNEPLNESDLEAIILLEVNETYDVGGACGVIVKRLT